MADTLPVSPYPTHGSTLLPASGSPSSLTLTRCYKQLSIDSQTQDQPVFQSDDSATHKELGCAPVLPTMVPKSQISMPPPYKALSASAFVQDFLVGFSYT